MLLKLGPLFHSRPHYRYIVKSFILCKLKNYHLV